MQAGTTITNSYRPPLLCLFLSYSTVRFYEEPVPVFLGPYRRRTSHLPSRPAERRHETKLGHAAHQEPASAARLQCNLTRLLEPIKFFSATILLSPPLNKR